MVGFAESVGEHLKVPVEWNVYEYRHPYLGDAVICDAETSRVQQYLSEEDFKYEFGGYVALTDKATGRAYLGVWGRRNSQRFRRLLRERGATIRRVRGEQPERRLRMWSKFPAAYHENRMARKAT